jgi:hypothetical protein
MDGNRRKLLIRKRGIAKSNLTSIKRYVDALDSNVDIYSIKVRLEALQQAWDEYNVVQDELEIEDQDQGESHADDRESFSESYYELNARMARLLDTTSVKAEPLASNPSSGSVQVSSNLQLPPIKLPVFSDKPTEFKHFFDTFNSLLVKNEMLDDIQGHVICCEFCITISRQPCLATVFVICDRDSESL